MKALIIEDEIIAAQALQASIKEVCPEVEILDVLQTIDESVEWFQQNAMPDLVFMDIHLADGSSFTIFEEVSISCPIIFTTAYDEYALKAFEVNSIDYLLKPINVKDMDRAIRKYKLLSAQPQDNTVLIDRLLAGLKQRDASYKFCFLVPEKDKLIPLPVRDIAYIYIDTKMVKAVTLNNRTYHIDRSLDDLMQQLNPDLFFRANRQFIISRDAIADLSVWFGNRLSVNLKVPPPEHILINKARVPEFKRWFAN